MRFGTTIKMLREITEKSEWDKMYSQAQVASGKFLQSWAWGELQLALGRKIFRFADDGVMVLIVELPLKFGKKYWFCPKGPIAYGNNQPMRLASQIPTTNFQIKIEELMIKAKDAGAVFLRIEPPVSDFSMPGLAHSHDVNPRQTSIIDLAKTEDELLAAMHPKTRYNIKVAEKHGVTIGRHADPAPVIDDVLKLFSETAARDKFRLHPLSYYKKQLEAFGEKKTFVPGVKSPHLVIFTANKENKILAAAIVMFDGTDVTYLHGASSNEMRNVMAPYALHWAIIKRAKERGYKTYDLWGISDNPKSGWAGITRFKRGWGGNDVGFCGAFDLPISRFWYSVYALVRRLRP